MKGFTLIEMLVSVAIFSIVMVIALGALLSISASDRKAESLKAVINNLNFAVDSMSRAIRTGSSYHCGSGGTVTTPQDCALGSNYVTFLSSNNSQVYYRLDGAQDASSKCGQTVLPYGCLERSTDGSTWLPITAPEVLVTDYSAASPASYLFYVVGSCPSSPAACTSDTVQPKVVITLSGFVRVSGGAASQIQCGSTGNQCSVFHLQTAVEQRIYDQ